MQIVREFGILIAGVAALVIGFVLVGLSGRIGFGWSAYAPLSNATFVPPYPFVLSAGGYLVAAIGLALSAGWIGYRLGRRRPD